MGEKRQWTVPVCEKHGATVAVHDIKITGERDGPDTCHLCHGPVQMVVVAPVEEESKWIRAFNRLEKAVTRHIDAKEWTDDADDNLHHAWKQVMKDVSVSGGRGPEGRDSA